MPALYNVERGFNLEPREQDLFERESSKAPIIPISRPLGQPSNATARDSFIESLLEPEKPFSPLVGLPLLPSAPAAPSLPAVTSGVRPSVVNALSGAPVSLLPSAPAAPSLPAVTSGVRPSVVNTLSGAPVPSPFSPLIGSPLLAEPENQSGLMPIYQPILEGPYRGVPAQILTPILPTPIVEKPTPVQETAPTASLSAGVTFEQSLLNIIGSSKGSNAEPLDGPDVSKNVILAAGVIIVLALILRK